MSIQLNPLAPKNAIALALASGLLAPTLLAPSAVQAAPKTARVHALTSSADDVTLDFVGA